ncbi:MAG: hypothetical protein ABEK04_01265 [Candidatus Nanohalobium sp.]
MVSHDETKPVEDRMEYLREISEQEIEEHFPESDLADSINYL